MRCGDARHYCQRTKSLTERAAALPDQQNRAPGIPGRCQARLEQPDSTEGVVVGDARREYDNLTPSQWSMTSTVVARRAAVVAMQHGLCPAWRGTPSASAVRLSRAGDGVVGIIAGWISIADDHRL